MKPTETYSIRSEACLSACGSYRYWLLRQWDTTKPMGAFICMNPFKADSLMMDMSLAYANNLAVHWGWGGFYIANMSAFMEPDSSRVGLHMQKHDAENDKAIKWVVSQAKSIVLAWSAKYPDRAFQVMKLLPKAGLLCIKKNVDGSYMHPRLATRCRDYPAPVPV